MHCAAAALPHSHHPHTQTPPTAAPDAPPHSQLNRKGLYRPLPDPYASGAPRQLAQSAALRLLSSGLDLLSRSGGLVMCSKDDGSLPLGVLAASGKYLVAASLVGAEEAMPNFVLQLLQVRGGGGGTHHSCWQRLGLQGQKRPSSRAFCLYSANRPTPQPTDQPTRKNDQPISCNRQWTLMMEPGTVYFSFYESGASDRTSFWMDVMRILLAPLRTPALAVARGDVTQGWVGW